jgi:MtfA peptidase
VLHRLRQWLRPDPPRFDPSWEQILHDEFEHWSNLDPVEADRMRMLVARFVRRTRWEAARGFDLSDEVKVLVAAQASLLLLGLEIDDYPHVSSVIVHRSTVLLQGAHPAGGGVWSSAPRYLSGQAQDRGPVVLSWSAVRRGARAPERGENVVYHEFAHRLDMLDGVTDGTPPLDDSDARRRWVEVCTTAYDAVRAAGSPVLRPYAGTNPAEFFAVATEFFFERPAELKALHPELYEQLAGYFHRDPAAHCG